MKNALLIVLILAGFISTGCKKNETGIVIETNMGNIEAVLYPDNAPVTVKNFLRYADEKFYDGTIFHRILTGMLVEGGGYTPDMKLKQAREPILNEATNGLSNLRGAIAMARTRDIHSSTSQFFINTEDNQFFDHGYHGYGYCVFGKVTGGMEVVDKIKNLPVKTIGEQKYIPADTVVILTIKRKKFI